MIFSNIEYCERRGSEMWAAEPVNMVSTIALIISAYFIFMMAKSKQGIYKLFFLLPLLLTISFIGNVIYHVMPNIWAYLLDVGSLGLYWIIILYLLFLLGSIGQRIKGIIMLTLGFLVAVLLRRLDQVICDSFTFGTHFVLHILLALCSYYSVKILLQIHESNKNKKSF